VLVLLVVGMIHHENDITIDTHTQEKRGNSKSDEDEGGEERKQSSWIWLKEWKREETDVCVRV